MSYPPPGGYDPQQYHVSGPQPQPSDPYAQGNNAPPPPPGYNPGAGQYPPPPNATPPIGVQPGYPPGGPPGVPPSTLPPPIPPPNQGSNLGIILGVIVGLVVILGVAAALIVPGMLEDDDEGSTSAGDDTSSEPADEESSPEEEESPSGEPTEGTGEEEGTGGGFEDWGTPVNSDEVDPNTPEGAGIAWQVAVDAGDWDAMADLMCSSPSEDLQYEYDYEVEYGSAPGYEFLIWGMSKEAQGGEVEVWAGWTWDDTAPSSQEDVDSGGGDYFTAVEEDGTWKLCDISF